MTSHIYKFSTDDIIRFIKIYRSHPCLWDTNDALYKNRAARLVALKAFAEELDIKGFGPSEINCKIKSIRTQYQAENKKTRDSITSGVSEVYVPKSPWFNLIHSFLKSSPKANHSSANSSSAPDEVVMEHISVVNEFTQEDLEDDSDSTTIDDKPTLLKRIKQRFVSSEVANKRVRSEQKKSCHHDHSECAKKRARCEETKDDLDNFGKYITSSLRVLSAKNCIYAQDEILGIVSKYKLKNIDEAESEYDWSCSRRSSEDD